MIRGLAALVSFWLSACTADVNGMPEPRSFSEERIEEGRRLIAEFGCGSCHFIPGVPGAAGRLGLATVRP